MEEDSLEWEILPFRVDFWASNLGEGMEELSLPTKSNLGFGFYFGFCFHFPIDVWVTIGYFAPVGLDPSKSQKALAIQNPICEKP